MATHPRKDSEWQLLLDAGGNDAFQVGPTARGQSMPGVSGSQSKPVQSDVLSSLVGRHPVSSSQTLEASCVLAQLGPLGCPFSRMMCTWIINGLLHIASRENVPEINGNHATHMNLQKMRFQPFQPSIFPPILRDQVISMSTVGSGRSQDFLQDSQNVSRKVWMTLPMETRYHTPAADLYRLGSPWKAHETAFLRWIERFQKDSVIIKKIL